MTYQSELETKLNFYTNIVIDIDGTKFSKNQVDSGLVIDTDKVGMVDTISINPTQVDLKSSLSTIDSATIRIIDRGNTFSVALYIGNDEGALIGKNVKIYVGRNTGSFDWSDYLLINEYRIKSISKDKNFYTISAKSQIDKAINRSFLFKGNLDNDIIGYPTSITIESDVDVSSDINHVFVESELIQFTSKTYSAGVLTLTGLTRGVLGSDIEDHEQGSECNFVFKIEENPIDILLKMLISTAGDGSSYDVYPDGAGIAEDLIDITSFTAIKNNYFPTSTFQIYIYDIDKTLEFLQNEILIPINCRLSQSGINKKITLVILDQFDYSSTPQIIDEDVTLPNPNWSLSEDGVVNRLVIDWDYREGDESFRKSNIFTNSQSIAKYGIKQEKLEFKGIKTALDGNLTIAEFASRYLGRFSTPRAEIGCTTFIKKELIAVGDKVTFIHSEIPQQGEGLGINTVVEVLKKSVNFKKGTLDFDLIFTSYSNSRIGVIAPSPILNMTIYGQDSFDIPSWLVVYYGVGYKCRLWSISSNAYLPDAVNTILDITGNTLTFENNWTTTLSDDVILKFADYDDCSEIQLKRFAFIGYRAADYNDDYNNDHLIGGDGKFADGKKAYQIIL